MEEEAGREQRVAGEEAAEYPHPSFLGPKSPFIPPLMTLCIRFAVAVVSALLPLAGASAQSLPSRRQTADSAAQRVRSDSIPRKIAPVIVTGTIVPASRDRLGLAVSVLGSGDLTAEPSFYASDALRKLPGAFIDEAAGPGGPTIVRVRGGEETFTNILIDGVKSNQNGGFFDFQGVTLTNVERI